MKSDDNLFMIAAVVGVGIIAYLAFSSTAPAAVAAAPAAPIPPNFGVNDPTTWDGP
jgi:hypothetical protein